jgi:hypothetical protein
MFRYNTFGALLALAISSVVGLDGPSSSCGVANFKVTHQGTPVGETKKINGGKDDSCELIQALAC